LAAPAAPHAAATASDCLAVFTTTLRKPSRFLMACEGAPCWATLHSANSVQSPHAVVLGEGAAAATATDCLATFTPTLRKPSRFLIARDDAP
jgi:hypothetical protein